MTDDVKEEVETITVQSSRFGELVVPSDTVIEFPVGIIGFPRFKRYIMLEHKPPFSWLHSVDDENLAFVVVDGLEFGQHYHLEPPLGDKDIDLKDDDEYAILVVVTVRPNPEETTANLKAPIFVNLRNRQAVQVIFDDQRLSTRHPLWAAGEGDEDSEEDGEEDGQD